MAGKSTKRKKQTGRKKKTQENNVLHEEILILCVLAVCVFFLVSNFGMGGIAGEAVSGVMFGVFGWMGYLMPILIFGVVAFLISNKGNTHAYIKGGAAGVLIILICALLELIANSYDASASLVSYYQQASIGKNAGGFLGGCVAKLFCPLLGIVGTYIVIIILAVICVILITEKSLLRPLGHKSRAAYEGAKKRHETSVMRSAQKKEERQKVRQEQELQRQKNRVSGVSFATTLTDSGTRSKRKSPELQELAASQEAIVKEPLPSPFEDLTIQRPEADIPDAAPVVGSEKQEKPAPRKRKTKETAKAVETETAQIDSHIKQAEENLDSDNYQTPPLSLLKKGAKASGDSDGHLRATALKLEETLQNFGVGVHVTNASCGPSVTRYELQPEQGVKVSRIVGLADDIKLNLAAADIRIEAPIPGKAAVGIEVPNSENTAVMLRDLLESEQFKNSKSKITFAVGKDISGKTVVADIGKMPHLLVAGATGSGKSVCINTLIMSILYKASPEEVKLIMIDPKVVELSVYNGIPHLLIPVVTDPKKAAGALNWAVAEMEKRYKLFAEYNVRDLKGFNEKLKTLEPSEDNPKKMSQIIIIVDELADLMMVAPGEVEGAICRLAQLARAAGLHLVLATQRPSVNVITGLIKANMPSRIAFAVSSGVDSRTIIDMNGAEKLLGKGDMLFYPTGYPKPVRVQGSFVSDKEVQEVVAYLLEQHKNVAYDSEIEEHLNTAASGTGATEIGGPSAEDDKDVYFVEAGKLIIEKEKASIGMLQRMFKIGFNRAARIMDQLAEAGVVGPEEGTKPRKVLMSESEFEEFLNESE